jgi:hypothetical protein
MCRIVRPVILVAAVAASALTAVPADAELMLERSVDRDELVAFACSLLPRLRERAVDGSSLGYGCPLRIPLMRPKGNTREGETDALD